ncbi:hypothetical protein D3C84_1041990 [compost metagenome]
MAQNGQQPIHQCSCRHFQAVDLHRSAGASSEGAFDKVQHQTGFTHRGACRDHHQVGRLKAGGLEVQVDQSAGDAGGDLATVKVLVDLLDHLQ